MQLKNNTGGGTGGGGGGALAAAAGLLDSEEATKLRELNRQVQGGSTQCYSGNYMLFKRSLSIFSMTSLKQHI